MKEDWEQINASNASIEQRILELMNTGTDPTSDEAMDVAEAQRAHISRWFYVLDHQFHEQQSELHVGDERFRARIEPNKRPGAADWIQAAIIANAERASRGQAE